MSDQWVWGGCWGTALVVPRGRTGFGQLGRAYPKCTQTSGVRTQIQSRMYDAITDEPLVQSCQTRVRWKALDELETMRSLLGSVEVVLASKAAGQGRDLFPFVRIRNIHLGNSEQRTGDKRNGCRRCRNGQAKSAGTTLYGIADSSRVCTGAHMYERTSQSGNDEERRPRPAAASRQQKPSRQVRSLGRSSAHRCMHVASLDSTGAHRTGRASIRSRSSEKCMCSLL